MAGRAPSAIISQLRHPNSTQEQISALKLLRNDIIGNQQRKDAWMSAGVLEAVVEAATLRHPYGPSGHQRIEDDTSSSQSDLNDSENVRLQALAVLGSFASNGLKFIGAIYATAALPAILANLDPSNNPPLVVLATLRVLNALAKSSLLVAEPQPANLLLLADALFSETNISSLKKILHQTCKSVNVDTQISYTASLVSILCCEDRHKNNLAGAGVLEALADVLAVVIVSQGLAVPRPGLQRHVEDLLLQSPIADPVKVDIGRILQALAAIIGDSRSRANALICSPSLQGIWHHGLSLSPWAGLSHSLVDSLNPQIPSRRSDTASPLSSAFPPLGSHDLADHEFFSAHSRAPSSLSKRSEYAEPSSECSTPKIAHDGESPLISYLVWLTRSSGAALGVMSASLLVSLYKLGMAAQHRDKDIALLVVPMLVQWLEVSALELSSCERIRAQCRMVEILASVVLAKFILDNDCLQKAAYDAGAIPKLCKILQSSYQPIAPGLDGRSWSPYNLQSRNGEASSPNKEYACPPLLVHNIKAREGALKAIAALIPFKEDYRKALVNQGVMANIVESLKPTPGKQKGEKADVRKESRGSARFTVCDTSPTLGVNPVPVLAAACATIQALSRSPSILRTTLADSGVVMPIFELLHYQNVEVQIAATAAVCNIVTEMSPMRQTISEAGILKILCQHARSNNVNMRYNALWALKHFVQAAGNETKKSCFLELGQEWLVRLICGDSNTEDRNDDPVNTARNALETDLDVPMGSADDEEHGYVNSYADLEVNHRFKDVATARLGRNTSCQFPDTTSSSTQSIDDDKQARKDDARVQEQGLDFLRNLIAGYGVAGSSEAPEMITYLLDAFREESLFELLTSKLRPKVQHPFSRGHSGINNRERTVCPPRPEILSTVAWIVVNIAASIPRHRQVLIRQTELLRLLMQNASHPSRDVRSAFCHMILNLTWADDDHDRIAAIARARELEKMGYVAKLDALLKDEDLDVRERAKTARFQILQGP